MHKSEVASALLVNANDWVYKVRPSLSMSGRLVVLLNLVTETAKRAYRTDGHDEYLVKK